MSGRSAGHASSWPASPPLSLCIMPRFWPALLAALGLGLLALAAGPSEFALSLLTRSTWLPLGPWITCTEPPDPCTACRQSTDHQPAPPPRPSSAAGRGGCAAGIRTASSASHSTCRHGVVVGCHWKWYIASLIAVGRFFIASGSCDSSRAAQVCQSLLARAYNFSPQLGSQTLAGQTEAAVRDVPAMVASRIAVGDTAGAADQLFRVFQVSCRVEGAALHVQRFGGGHGVAEHVPMAQTCLPGAPTDCYPTPRRTSGAAAPPSRRSRS